MHMSVTKVARIAGTAGMLMTVPLVTAVAQTQSPPPSPPTPPTATTPQPNAPPAAAPPTERKFAAPVFIELVGLAAKSSDGTNLGTVHTVVSNPGGKTTIGVRVGSFLGFGGHMVAIPDGKFNRMGDTVQVNMTADEVQKLPQAVEQK
jgi:PRC-barrel domain